MNRKHTLEPRWKSYSRLRHAAIPAAVLDWLLDPTSLTRRLILSCGGEFRVQVLEQGWNKPQRNERRALRMRLADRAWIREVQLLCDGQPWVYARTIIPHRTLTGRQRRLAFLGNRPLGAVLFADPHMRRGPLQICRLREQHDLYAHALQGAGARKNAELWGRRSVFYLAGKPLLVSEFFLPGLLGG